MTAFALWAGTAALLAGVLTVTRATVVHALMYLVAMLLALATVFFALGASFAGAMQILVYAGAIVAVFVFVVMTVDSSPAAAARERSRLRGAWRGPALLVGLMLLPLFAGLPGGGVPALPVSARAVGALLFGPWALAVELASFLLLAALLGARHLARRSPEEK
ncbi:NADH-quinone oxidoreductase subunit J [Polymorphobacter sp.]|uniref:NADH-quinone oxidoreductase subunit J n=1 Tax=Polymorphobacter sp. TaxID=1909290 RepID=UPI003F72DCEC